MRLSTPVQDLRGVLFRSRYEILDHIASGGNGDTFLAQDKLSDRAVALKVIFPELSAEPTFPKRFRNAAQSAAGLSHPNIVAVYDWGEDEGDFYIAMEYVNGKSLSELLMEGALPLPRAAWTGAKVAAALSFAHSKGLAHGDLKPDNILIDRRGAVKVSDFGISNLRRSATTPMNNHAAAATASYLSPEQVSGLEVDQRSDIYSLGVVLYEMATGDVPFRGDSTVDVALKHVAEDALPLREIDPSIPLTYEKITTRAMMKSPDERYPAASPLRDDLARFHSEYAGQEDARPEHVSSSTKVPRARRLPSLNTKALASCLVVLAVGAWFALGGTQLLRSAVTNGSQPKAPVTGVVAVSPPEMEGGGAGCAPAGGSCVSVSRAGTLVASVQPGVLLPALSTDTGYWHVWSWDGHTSVINYQTKSYTFSSDHAGQVFNGPGRAENVTLPNDSKVCASWHSRVDHRWEAAECVIIHA